MNKKEITNFFEILKNTYPDIDIEDLQRTLEIKKSNYKRLTR